MIVKVLVGEKPMITVVAQSRSNLSLADQRLHLLFCSRRGLRRHGGLNVSHGGPWENLRAVYDVRCGQEILMLIT